jgi:hypothetical protein
MSALPREKQAGTDFVAIQSKLIDHADHPLFESLTTWLSIGTGTRLGGHASLTGPAAKIHSRFFDNRATGFDAVAPLRQARFEGNFTPISFILETRTTIPTCRANVVT